MNPKSQTKLLGFMLYTLTVTVDYLSILISLTGSIGARTLLTFHS